MESQPAAVKRRYIEWTQFERYPDTQRRQICPVIETKIGLQSAVSQLTSLILLV